MTTKKTLSSTVCFSKEAKIMLVYRRVMSEVKYMKNQQHKAINCSLVGLSETKLGLYLYRDVTKTWVKSNHHLKTRCIGVSMFS